MKQMTNGENNIKKKKLTVICDGREISYGMALIHMFKYENDDGCINSSFGKNYDAKMYSFVAYKHATIGKNVIKIFVGKTYPIDSSVKLLFAKYGMSIYKKGADYIFTVAEISLKNGTYEEFIKYANKKRTAFLLYEKEYADKVSVLNSKWLPGPFALVQSMELFGKANRQKIQQLYDCMAYVFYLDFIVTK